MSDFENVNRRVVSVVSYETTDEGNYFFGTLPQMVKGKPVELDCLFEMRDPDSSIVGKKVMLVGYLSVTTVQNSTGEDVPYLHILVKEHYVLDDKSEITAELNSGHDRLVVDAPFNNPDKPNTTYFPPKHSATGNAVKGYMRTTVRVDRYTSEKADDGYPKKDSTYVQITMYDGPSWTQEKVANNLLAGKPVVFTGTLAPADKAYTNKNDEVIFSIEMQGAKAKFFYGEINKENKEVDKVFRSK